MLISGNDTLKVKLYSSLILGLAVAAGIMVLIISGGRPNGLTNFVRFLVVPICTIPLVITILNQPSPIPDQLRLNRTSFNYKLVLAVVIYLLIISTLKFLKSSSLNYEFFDAGIYISKLWRIANSDINGAWRIASVEGHFQPIMLIYGLVYKWTSSHLTVFALETITLASGVFPIYLLAKKKLGDESGPLFLSLAYLISPILSFNDILGFHPDHLVLPLLLWAFYFSETTRYWASVLALIMISLVSTPWIPTAAAFGIYLYYGPKQKLIGSLVCIGFSSFFFLLVFYLLPNAGSITSGQQIFGFDGGVSGHSISRFSSLDKVLDFLFDPRRIFFILFLFLPFMFLPLGALAIFCVAVPDFLKTVGSSEMLHYSVEGHYTLAIFAVLFVGYIQTLSSWNRKTGDNISLKISMATLVISSVLSICHSSLPVSYNFWSDWSGGAFHYRNYLADSRTQSLRYAESLIGSNVNDIVEITNGAFTPKLARRESIRLFPSLNWKKSQYILLDKDKFRGSGSDSGNDDYSRRMISTITALPSHFRIIYEDIHIQLWARNL